MSKGLIAAVVVFIVCTHVPASAAERRARTGTSVVVRFIAYLQSKLAPPIPAPAPAPDTSPASASRKK